MRNSISLLTCKPLLVVNHSRSDNKANEIGICLGASHETKGGIWVFVPYVDKEPKMWRKNQGMPMTQEFINLVKGQAIEGG